MLKNGMASIFYFTLDRWFGFEGNASDKAETNIQIAVIL